jgi:hypothetical protein
MPVTGRPAQALSQYTTLITKVLFLGDKNRTCVSGIGSANELSV